MIIGLCAACAGSDPGGEPPADAADQNQAPVARAGDDRALLAPARVVLDGTASSDPDGDPLTYRWRIVAAPAASTAALDDATAAQPELLLDRVGIYEVSLTVSDGRLTSAADVVRLTTSGGAPIANAGADRSVHWGATVQLDGSASVDPQNDPLVYTWTITNRPAGSAAVLASPATATPTFVADVVGRYDVQLTVGDGGAQSTDVVSVTATNGAPIARAGNDAVIASGAAVTLDGAASSDPDGDPLTYAWSVTSAPAGSVAAPAAPAQATTTFTPAVIGNYVLTLTVRDGAATATDTVALTVYQGGNVIVLPHDVVDAEYSNALDAIVAVSSSTNSLHIIDPESGVERTVALPLTPTSVSVAPNGNEAIVGHNGWISVVDLVAGVRTAVWTNTADAIDVIHGGNGWAYVMPRVDQWQRIRCVRLDTGVETLGTGLIYAGAVARRHPTRPALYMADRGISPSDIEDHDLAGGPSRFLRDSPYHGDYAMCGDLWFSDDGNRIFTACGNVFRATTDPATDMTYNGSLGMIGISYVDHSAAAHLVAVMPKNGFQQVDADQVVRFFEDVFLAPAAVVNLPPIVVNNALVADHGRFVFWNAAGTRFYVLMRATPPVGAVRDTLWAADRPAN